MAAIATSAFALASASNASATITVDKLWLDTHTDVPGAKPEVSTTKPLTPNGYYVALVQGTYSLWSGTAWAKSAASTSGDCGVPEAAPMYPSPGVNNTKVGVDSAVIFGAPRGSSTCPLDGTSMIPQSNSLFLIDQGSGAQSVPPIGGSRTKANKFHLYGYILKGQGSAAAFRFINQDYASSDNSGQLKITVIGGFKSAKECAAFMN